MINVRRRFRLSLRSQPSLLTLTKLRRRRKSDGLKKTDELSRMESWLVSMRSTGGGTQPTGRPSGLTHQTQLSIIPGFHCHGNTSAEGHLSASRSPAFYNSHTHRRVGGIFHGKVGNVLLTPELITDKVLMFGKLQFSAWVHGGEGILALVSQITWWQSGVKVSTHVKTSPGQRAECGVSGKADRSLQQTGAHQWTFKETKPKTQTMTSSHLISFNPQENYFYSNSRP